MKVALLGTSNSVLRHGFSTGLAYGLGGDVRFDNVSVGIGGIFLNECIERLDGRAYDFVLIDCAVNDEILARNTPAFHPLFVDNFQSLLARVAAAGSCPVPIILPRQDALETGQVRTASAYIRTCQDNRIPFANVYKLVRQSQRLTELPFAAYFKDAAHLHRPLAGIVGAGVAAALATLNGRPARMADLQAPSGYGFVPVTGCSGIDPARIVPRRTSLRSDQVYRIVPGETIGLPLARGRTVVGVMFNSSRSGGRLVVQGAGPAHAMSVTPPEEQSDRMLINGGVVTWDMGEGEAPEARVSVDPLPGQDPAEAGIELVGFVLGDGIPFSAEARLRHSDPLDMLSGAAVSTLGSFSVAALAGANT